MALYNNGYPVNYNQYYSQFQNQQPYQSNQGMSLNNQGQSSITWVSGEAGAKAYLVAPNTTVQLWDSEDQIIYLKSADASGMPSMKIIDYTIRGSETAQNSVLNNKDDYMVKDDLKPFIAKIERLEKEINELKSSNIISIKEV